MAISQMRILESTVIRFSGTEMSFNLECAFLGESLWGSGCSLLAQRHVACPQPAAHSQRQWLVSSVRTAVDKSCEIDLTHAL